MADDASAAQRSAFVNDAAARALETPDKPLTPEGIERAWSAHHGFGRSDLEGATVLVLWNFDVASARLKWHHQKALKQFFQTTALARGSTASESPSYRVTGFASATGAEKYNDSVSRRRAEEVAAFISAEFGVAPLRIDLYSQSDHAQRGAAAPADPGEWYARYRQVRIERVLAPVVPPPSAFDGPEPFQPGPPAPRPSTGEPSRTVVPVSFEFAVPPSPRVFDVGGWVYIYASFSVQGKITLVSEGADASAGIKGAVSLNDMKKKLKVEAEKKLTDNIKLKLGADIGELSKKPGAGPGVKGALSFKELGPFTNVELGFNLSRPAAPASFAQSWKETYPFEVDGQPMTFEAQVQGTLYVGLGKKSIARLGQIATRAVQATMQVVEGATVVEGGATVGTAGIGGLAAAGIAGGAVVAAATLVGIAMVLDEGKEEVMEQAALISRRHGFALALAVEVLGHGPETNRYASAVEAEYPRIGTWKSFSAGRAEALDQIGKGNREALAQWREAVRAQYGDQVEKLHQALFVALGGLEKGDPDKALRLADIPVRVP